MFYSWYVLSLHFDYPYTPLFIYTEGILSVFKLPAWLDPQRYTMMLYVQLFLASVILSTPPRSCPSGLYYILPNFGLWNLPILISLPFARIWYPSITAHLNYLITLQPRSPRLPLLLHPTARPSPAASVKRLLTKLGATGLQTPQSRSTATCSTFSIRTGTYFKTRGITEGWKSSASFSSEQYQCHPGRNPTAGWQQC